MAYNKVILMGRLTGDPEVRYTNDQKAVANYNIAVDRDYKDNDGKYPTDFFKITAFEKNGEFAEKYLKKGMLILVEGSLQNSNYTDKNGNKVYQNSIIVTKQKFCESKSSNNQADAKPQTDSDGFMKVPESIDEDLPFAKPTR